MRLLLHSAEPRCHVGNFAKHMNIFVMIDCHDLASQLPIVIDHHLEKESALPRGQATAR